MLYFHFQLSANKRKHYFLLEHVEYEITNNVHLFKYPVVIRMLDKANSFASKNAKNL